MPSSPAPLATLKNLKMFIFSQKNSGCQDFYQKPGTCQALNLSITYLVSNLEYWKVVLVAQASCLCCFEQAGSLFHHSKPATTKLLEFQCYIKLIASRSILKIDQRDIFLNSTFDIKLV
jgi:hypothetical protein